MTTPTQLSAQHPLTTRRPSSTPRLSKNPSLPKPAHSDSFPEMIKKSLLAETGALNPTLYPYVHTSSLGAIPKKHSEKWRLILDLSHPKPHSGISRQLCSLTYTKVDYIIPRIISSGRDTLLAKIDIKNAFRNVPIHPDDRHLLVGQPALRRHNLALWPTLGP